MDKMENFNQKRREEMNKWKYIIYPWDKWILLKCSFFQSQFKIKYIFNQNSTEFFETCQADYKLTWEA